jgi:hypothetical protein
MANEWWRLYESLSGRTKTRAATCGTADALLLDPRKPLPGNRLERIEKKLVDPNILSLYQLSETLNKADALAAEIAITSNSTANGEEKSQVLSHAGNVAGRLAQDPARSPLAHPIAANQMLHHRSTPRRRHHFFESTSCKSFYSASDRYQMLQAQILLLQLRKQSK